MHRFQYRLRLIDDADRTHRSSREDEEHKAKGLDFIVEWSEIDHCPIADALDGEPTRLIT